MSKWLSSVNNLLEKLDDTAEAVAEERRATGEDDVLPPAPEIEQILAKRGLAAESDENQVQESPTDNESAVELDDFDALDEFEKKVSEHHSEESVQDDEGSPIQKENLPISDEGKTNSEPSEVGEGTIGKNTDKLTSAFYPEDDRKIDSSAPKVGGSKGDDKAPDPATAAKSVPTIQAKSLPAAASKSEREMELVTEAKEAQKEARTLRRHVVSLNSQLESAEVELHAQRNELERAAEQMEKDRARAKEAKAIAKQLHTKELETVRSQHERALNEQQERFEQQVELYRNKLRDMESQKKQEDGDWSKEMTSVMEREKELNQQLMSLEDEKVTLLSQIATLQGQQEVLGSRLESLTQAADNAVDREREAEDRLDKALTQHARQISQRQTREAELERTIQELNAALVAKSRTGTEAQSLKSDNKIPEQREDTLSISIETLQNEYDTVLAHLALEKEKSEALQVQLREMSKESTLEASASHAMQLQYDRKVADLELTISKLQRDKMQKNMKVPDTSGATSIHDNDEMSKQVKILSEQLISLREKISNQSSETSALKNRLQIAVDRAKKAEGQLAMMESSGTNGDYDVAEKGNLQPGLGRRRRKAPNSGSIRTAMRLNTGQGERTEQIGKVVDVVDSFAVTTGKYLRRNPIARAGFIFYLLLIHLWTFVLLFFHAHSFDTVGNDTVGTAIRVVHGPGALLQKGGAQMVP